jgi:uncharacterized protein YigE (DUF2233 family)
VFHLYRAAPGELTLHWKGADGQPMRTFAAVEAHLRGLGREPEFLMNAGIFEPGGVPSGLHVEDGRELNPLNLADGAGNFYLKPNGVFFVDRDGAHVVTSEAYAALNPGPQPRFALQSGPMLLIGGKSHPAFQPQSDNRLHRNGVGVLADGRVVFVMTDLSRGTRINLYGFAMLFRELGCRDALFLDGDLSQMALRREGRLDLVDAPGGARRELAPGVEAGNHFGAVLAVAKDQEAAGTGEG